VVRGELKWTWKTKTKAVVLTCWKILQVSALVVGLLCALLQILELLKYH
jgi:hypothetical protein